MPLINPHLFELPRPPHEVRISYGRCATRGLFKTVAQRNIDDPRYWLSAEEYFAKYGCFPPGEGWPKDVSAARKAELKREAAQRYRDRKTRAGDA